MVGRGVSFHADLVLGMAWSLKVGLAARRCIDTGLLKSPSEVAQRDTGIHTVSGKTCPIEEMSFHISTGKISSYWFEVYFSVCLDTFLGSTSYRNIVIKIAQ